MFFSPSSLSISHPLIFFPPSFFPFQSLSFPPQSLFLIFHNRSLYSGHLTFLVSYHSEFSRLPRLRPWASNTILSSYATVLAISSTLISHFSAILSSSLLADYTFNLIITFLFSSTDLSFQSFPPSLPFFPPKLPNSSSLLHSCHFWPVHFLTVVPSSIISSYTSLQ